MNRGAFVALAIVVLFVVGLQFLMPGEAPAQRRVVVYTSVDDLYAIPIFERFEKETGIRVDAVFDTEATKAVSLANRIVAERSNPRADVFWNGEILRTLMLQQGDLLAAYRSPSAADIPATWSDPAAFWTGFAARARVIVYRAGMEAPPASLEDLAHPRFRGQVGFARPTSGTAATHVAALVQTIGRGRALGLLRRWKENGLRIYPGNSPVRDAIVRGEISVGVVDTDDVWIGKDGGKGIEMLYPDADGIGTLVIPNTVALVRGGPNSVEARRLVDFLLSRETEAELARGRSRQLPVRDLPVPEGVTPLSGIRAMKVDWPEMPRVLRQIEDEIESLFAN